MTPESNNATFYWTPRPAWFDDAACKGAPVDVFFPGQKEPIDKALAFCRSCPVTVECGKYALANGERFGIWGGGSERLRRQQRRAWRDEHHTTISPTASIWHGTTVGYSQHLWRNEPACAECQAAHDAKQAS